MPSGSSSPIFRNKSIRRIAIILVLLASFQVFFFTSYVYKNDISRLTDTGTDMDEQVRSFSLESLRRWQSQGENPDEHEHEHEHATRPFQHSSIILEEKSKSSDDVRREQKQKEAHNNKHRNHQSESTPRNGHEDKVKIVAFTDNTYAPVAKWWYQRMTNLSYTTHTLVLIDQLAVEHFTSIHNHNQTMITTQSNNNGVNVIKRDSTRNSDDNDYRYRFDVQIVDEGKRRKNKVRSLWYNRILYCLNQLKVGQSLLLTDVDNIFSRHQPLAPFYESGYDAIFALEQKFPTQVYDAQGFVVCGGMTFFKATNATIQVMERLLERCDGGTKRCDDQVEWNQLLWKEMDWDTVESKKRPTEDGMLQYGFEGRYKRGIIPGLDSNNFRAKVWDRDFAWRGIFSRNTTCPSLDNWVAMPANLPWDIQKSLDALGGDEHKNIVLDASIEKLARVKIWENFCGVNGTHRQQPNSKAQHSSNTDTETDTDTLGEALTMYIAKL